MYESFLIWAYGGVGIVTLIGYLPQIWKLITSTGRSKAMSLNTWVIWMGTSSIAFLYALSIAKDPIMMFTMGANVAGCGTIVLLTLYNRHVRFRDPPLHVEIAEKLNIMTEAGMPDSKKSFADQV